MRVKLPSTNSQVVNGAKLDYLMAYPDQALLLGFFDYTGSVVTISPRKNRNGTDDYVVTINNVLYEGIHDGTDQTLDLTSTGLNGLIDGITFTAADGKDFLIWALANDVNTEFQGFALTHKPYSAYTSPASVNKGASGIFTVTNGFQFTEGARVGVSNTNGTAPRYEWNWGTITSINSNTSITILMDNNGNYGDNLTSATGGEIRQWDLFRPWVVGSTQELYSDSYRLIGEMYTDTSGNVAQAYRADDPWRNYSYSQRIYDNGTASISGTLFTGSFGRFIPLWTKQGSFLMTARNTTTNEVYQLICSANAGGGSGIQIEIIASGTGHRAAGIVGLNSNCTVSIVVSTTTTNTLFRCYLIGYYVPGGMRI